VEVRVRSAHHYQFSSLLLRRFSGSKQPRRENPQSDRCNTTADADKTPLELENSFCHNIAALDIRAWKSGCLLPARFSKRKFGGTPTDVAKFALLDTCSRIEQFGNFSLVHAPSGPRRRAAEEVRIGLPAEDKEVTREGTPGAWKKSLMLLQSHMCQQEGLSASWQFPAASQPSRS
jgi:hypothetical protein